MLIGNIYGDSNYITNIKLGLLIFLRVQERPLNIFVGTLAVGMRLSTIYHLSLNGMYNEGNLNSSNSSLFLLP